MNLRLFLPLAVAVAALPAFAQGIAPSEKPAAPATPAPATAPGDNSSLLDPLPAEPGASDATILPPPSDPGFSMPQLKSRPSKEDEKEVEKASRKDEIVEGSIEDRIKFRTARTRAARDPKIMDAAERAATATTDPEKRAALSDYYALLFAQIRKFEPSIEPMVAAAEKQVARRLDPVTAEELDKKEHFEKKQARKAAAAADASPAPKKKSKSH